MLTSQVLLIDETIRSYQSGNLLLNPGKVSISSILYIVSETGLV